MRWWYTICCACPGTLSVERYTDAPTRGAAQAIADADAESYGQRHCSGTAACPPARMARASMVERDGWSPWDPDARREAMLHHVARSEVS